MPPATACAPLEIPALPCAEMTAAAAGVAEIALRAVDEATGEGAGATGEWTDQPWARFVAGCGAQDCAGLPVLIQRAVDLTGVDGSAIAAVLKTESGLSHFDKRGRVVRGDGGHSIGIGQIQRSWERYYSYDHSGEFPDGSRKVRVDDRADNVLLCAVILKHEGWAADDLPAQLAAYAGYNGGSRGKHSLQALHYAERVGRTCAAIAHYGQSDTGKVPVPLEPPADGDTLTAAAPPTP